MLFPFGSVSFSFLMQVYQICDQWWLGGHWAINFTYSIQKTLGKKNRFATIFIMKLIKCNKEEKRMNQEPDG